MSPADAVDVAVVGGGAAGIAAARTIAAAGRSVLILEAGPRLGGRAYTAMVEGLPLDLGCGWLHSADRNPMAALADTLGFAIDCTGSAWRAQWRELGFPEEAQAAARAAFDGLVDRLRGAPPASDRAADAMVPGCPHNGWLDAVSSYINGAALRDLSVADYLAYDAAATDANWRVPAGYGTLVASAAAGLPAALDTPVTAIDASGAILALATAKGTVGARAAIVAVPTSVLAGDAIRLPAVLDDRRHAASRLPLGLADKLFLAVEGAHDLDPDSHLIGSPWRAATGSYYLRPFGRPLIECFLAGDCARVLEDAGEGATVAFALDELAALLGTAWRRRLRPVAVSAWCRVPRFGGSYSHALPGHAAARATLRAPAADGRILFAGEACAAHDFSTAHGAWETGIAAARTALTML